jgi:ATP-dependent DNA helicase 2 subunit 2
MFLNPSQAKNERMLRDLAEESGGNFGTMEEAIKELGCPRLKTVRPIPSYKGLLMLGNPETYDSALCINVERYPRTMVARPPTASQFVIRSDMAPGESSAQSSATLQNEPLEKMLNGDGLAAVKNARTYQVPDPDAPGGKRDVAYEDLAKGYEYGRTAVHISESDANVTKIETQAGLEIVGFVPREKVD